MNGMNTNATGANSGMKIPGLDSQLGGPAGQDPLKMLEQLSPQQKEMLVNMLLKLLGIDPSMLQGGPKGAEAGGAPAGGEGPAGGPEGAGGAEAGGGAEAAGTDGNSMVDQLLQKLFEKIFGMSDTEKQDLAGKLQQDGNLSPALANLLGAGPGAGAGAGA